jgi:nucleoside-diphosphate-sugar epimerase
MAKAIVTGGAGFIGSHLAEELARRAYEVLILDDLSTGKMENIKGLLDRGLVTFVQGTITELPLLQKLFDNVDYVFHQAALARVPFSVQNPLAVNEINVTGTLNVLLAARDSGVKKVIYASSAAVYGDTATLPHKEAMVPNPQSPYAVTKIVAEYYCQVFQVVYGLPTVALRYFNVYGPKQDPNSDYAAVIPRFIKRASDGKSLIIFGDGEQTRDFVFASDVVRANILAAETGATGIFNIGQGRRVTINELAKLIIGIANKDLGVTYKGAMVGDIRHSLADISKARLFGYEPQYDLDQGLRETISDLL